MGSACYSDDPSLNPMILQLFCKIVIGKNENKQKEA